MISDNQQNADSFAEVTAENNVIPTSNLPAIVHTSHLSSSLSLMGYLWFLVILFVLLDRIIRWVVSNKFVQASVVSCYDTYENWAFN